MAFRENFKSLKIRLVDIKSATDDFDPSKCIGGGGFGRVYKGELSHSKGRSMVAIKRLDRALGQGNIEFWKEIMMLSSYRHENIIPLLGFCDEDNEKILVYEYASHGSLDFHLSGTSLTCAQRIKICVEAACGLAYLHDPKGFQQRVIHRDIKSANILLDENWKAKIADFGLSKLGPANQQFTFLVSNVAGTVGYCDPLYLEHGLLTKESDVFSFGVVLFEILCGRLCYQTVEGEPPILVVLWRHSYENEKLNEIISNNVREQIAKNCLDTISMIAYKCLEKDGTKRPVMAEVVQQLELALEIQEDYEDVDPPNYEDIVQRLKPALVYNGKQELNLILSNGILLDNGTAWLSINCNGDSCEMISSTKFFFNSNVERSFASESRFSQVVRVPVNEQFTAKVKTQFLSPGVEYAINLVFCYSRPRMVTAIGNPLCSLMTYSQENLPSEYGRHADLRGDGWLMTELYRFTSHRKKIDIEIMVVVHFPFNHNYTTVILEGIEFWPVEKDNNVMGKLLTSDSDLDWEKMLARDFLHIIRRSKDEISHTTKKELYLRLSKGILIKDKYYSLLLEPKSYEWFSLDENGRKCLMQPAKRVLSQALDKSIFDSVKWESCPGYSRFSLVAKVYRFIVGRLRVCSTIESQLLSPHTRYACYFVYKTEFGDDLYDSVVLINNKNGGGVGKKLAYLITRRTPTLQQKRGQWSKVGHAGTFTGHTHSYPKQRNDGWMEVQIWEFTTSAATDMEMSLEFECLVCHLGCLIVEGIEFRPL